MSVHVSTAIVCRSALFREGLRQILSNTHYAVLPEDQNMSGGLPPDASDPPRLFIFYFDNHDRDWKSSITEIHERWPLARIMIVASFCDVGQMMQAFRLGVNGYLVETVTAEALTKSLDVIMLDGLVMPYSTIDLLETSVVSSQVEEMGACLLPKEGSDAAGHRGLSARETSILRSLVLGASNKHIARDLEIAEATVKVHVKAILRKIHVCNRTQAAIWANNHGFCTEPVKIDFPRALVHDEPKAPYLKILPASLDQARSQLSVAR